MGAYKRYTEKELAIAVKAVKETTDREKLGWATRLANRLQAEGVFPGRTYNSIYGIVAKAADIVKLDEIKEKIPQNRMGGGTNEQQTLFATVPVSEQLLREKHNAEHALTLLKNSIIGDATGIHYGELKYCYSSITRAVKFLFPDEYKEKVNELTGGY